MSDMDAIASLAFVLNDSERELAEALRQVDLAQQRATNLRQEVEALRAALKRRRRGFDPESSRHSLTTLDDLMAEAALLTVRDDDNPWGTSRTDDWSGIPRTDAVERVLRELAGDDGLSPNEIHSLLQERGRSDVRDHVSAALTHLKNNGRAHRSGRAKWLPGPENAETPVAAGVSVRDWSAQDQSWKEGGAPHGAATQDDDRGALHAH